MSEYIQTTTIGWAPPIGLQNFRGETEIEKSNPTHKTNVIIVDDIPDIPIAKPSTAKTVSYLNLIGVVPETNVYSGFWQKIALAGIITTFVTIWGQNVFLYSLCILASIVNFLTSIFFDKEISHRDKISTFVADWILMGIVAVLAQIIAGSLFQLPHTQLSIPIITLVLTYFSVAYIWQITRRLLPMSTLVKSKTMNSLALAFKKAWRTGVEEFEKNQESA